MTKTQISEDDLDRTGMWYVDRWGYPWVRIMDLNCPPAFLEYAMEKYPMCIDHIRGRVGSGLFIGEEFADWLREKDYGLADLFGLDVYS